MELGASRTCSRSERSTRKVVFPMPPARKTIIALFDDVPTAGETVGKILDAGTVPAKIELLDNWVVRSINRITGMGLTEEAAAMLMFECDGTEDVVAGNDKILFCSTFQHLVGDAERIVLPHVGDGINQFLRHNRPPVFK